MSLKYIRDYYKVPVKRGQVIIFEYDNGLEYKGYITSSEGGYIRVRIETCSDGHIKKPFIMVLHPTFNIKYLEENKNVSTNKK